MRAFSGGMSSVSELDAGGGGVSRVSREDTPSLSPAPPVSDTVTTPKGGEKSAGSIEAAGKHDLAQNLPPNAARAWAAGWVLRERLCRARRARRIRQARAGRRQRERLAGVRAVRHGERATELPSRCLGRARCGVPAAAAALPHLPVRAPLGAKPLLLQRVRYGALSPELRRVRRRLRRRRRRRRPVVVMDHGHADMCMWI